METQEILKRYISENLLNSRFEVGAEDDLLGNDWVDSMGIMRLIAFIEEKFEITVPLEDVTIENFRTVQTIDTYLNK
ncbi:acyl carrier protein [Dapis sp. BLCC M126]|uniref:acyl carrier protein n=1 Tax=Dapis sp. BLCC M126 TaxID=3400189 RepID=UPI003CEB45BA